MLACALACSSPLPRGARSSPLLPCVARTRSGFSFEELDEIPRPGLGTCPCQASGDMPAGPAPAGRWQLLVPLLAITEDILDFLVPQCRRGLPGGWQVNPSMRTGPAEAEQDVAATRDGAIAASPPGARQGDPKPHGDEPRTPNLSSVDGDSSGYQAWPGCPAVTPPAEPRGAGCRRGCRSLGCPSKRARLSPPLAAASRL